MPSSFERRLKAEIYGWQLDTLSLLSIVLNIFCFQLYIDFVCSILSFFSLVLQCYAPPPVPCRRRYTNSYWLIHSWIKLHHVYYIKALIVIADDEEQRESRSEVHRRSRRHRWLSAELFQLEVENPHPNCLRREFICAVAETGFVCRFSLSLSLFYPLNWHCK